MGAVDDEARTRLSALEARAVGLTGELAELTDELAELGDLVFEKIAVQGEEQTCLDYCPFCNYLSTPGKVLEECPGCEALLGPWEVQGGQMKQREAGDGTLVWTQEQVRRRSAQKVVK